MLHMKTIVFHIFSYLSNIFLIFTQNGFKCFLLQPISCNLLQLLPYVSMAKRLKVYCCNSLSEQ